MDRVERSMRMNRDDLGASRIVTLDIETTHFKPAEGEVVSIGVAEHERGTRAEDTTYHLVHRDGEGEAATIQRGLDTVAESEPDILVSYNGKSFDIDFLRQRLHRLGQPLDAVALPAAKHVDLFVDRQQRASRMDEKWPKLEECLEAYGHTPAKTVWEGAEVTNVRFGDELGPAYLRALREGRSTERQQLCDIIDHYLMSDLEANLCLYYADIGETYEPIHVGSERAFSIA